MFRFKYWIKIRENVLSFLLVLNLICEIPSAKTGYLSKAEVFLLTYQFAIMPNWTRDVIPLSVLINSSISLLVILLFENRLCQSCFFLLTNFCAVLICKFFLLISSGVRKCSSGSWWKIKMDRTSVIS